MQPTYLPWLGTLDLARQADRFVLLDDVTFQRSSWQHRCRIKTQDGVRWLTVPASRNEQIADVRIANPGFWRKHLQSLGQAYARAPFGRSGVEALAGFVEDSGGLPEGLADANERLLRFLLPAFDIATPVLRSSSLGIATRRGEKLAGICEKLGASEYLSPGGSVPYLLEDRRFFSERGIEIQVARFEPPRHAQLHGAFEPGLTSLDLWLNEGPDAPAILATGTRPYVSLDEAAELRIGSKGADR